MTGRSVSKSRVEALTYTNLTQTSVVLSWNIDPCVNAYILLRSTDTSKFTMVVQFQLFLGGIRITLPWNNAFWPTAVVGEADSVNSVSASACHIGIVKNTCIYDDQVHYPRLATGNPKSMSFCHRILRHFNASSILSKRSHSVRS